MSEGIKIITKNRTAHHEYHISDTYEAGLVLKGSEIKSIRGNRINLKDGFVQARGSELWLLNVHIALYDQANQYGHTDPTRARKLLLHKREIAQIMTWIRENSQTAIPTRLYLKHGLAKVEIGLATGKKLHDKRQDLAKRDAQRQIERALKDRYR
jgi:SsrA-binding protein